MLKWTFLLLAGCATVREATPITRTLLQSSPLAERPGWETRLYLIEYAPGAEAPPHRHDFVGLGYVVSGRFESAFEGEASVVVHTGQSFQDRAGVVHRLFRNPDARQPLRFIIGYALPLGAPTLEPL